MSNYLDKSFKEINKLLPDPATGKIYDRLLVDQDKVKEYLKYEEAGNKMLDDAINLAKKIYGIKYQKYYICNKEGHSNCVIRSFCKLYNKEYDK